MENPEAAADYVSSPNASPERSQQQLSNSAAESVEITTHLKFLVSNAEAGSVIGKGGTTITEFQSQSGARIQLSRNHEVFPGTSDRIIMVSGTFDQVLTAMDLIFSKLLSEIYNEDGDNADPKSRVSLIVPNGSCGGIIGKGGATIKSFIEESGAGIKISPQDAYHNRLNDRLVIISGSLDEQLHAIRLVLSKLVEDPHYSQHANAPFAYAAAYGANFGTNGARGKFQNNKIPYNVQQEDRSNSTTIGISDDHIGLVVGRGGRNIMEISQISGARIKISDRGDFMSGTNDRKVTITGSERAIRAAEDMIMQKVNSISEVAN